VTVGFGFSPNHAEKRLPSFKMKRGFCGYFSARGLFCFCKNTAGEDFRLALKSFVTREKLNLKLQKVKADKLFKYAK